MGYGERASRLRGTVVWTRDGRAERDPYRVLPDGCLDVLWVDGELTVAGPDTRAWVSVGDTGTRYAGLRFAPGWGPLVLGVPAHELRDRRLPLNALWPDAVVRELTGRVTDAEHPAHALENCFTGYLRTPERTITAIAAELHRGASVAATADRVGFSERQLYRRSLDAFGYGPKVLGRILRLGRALELARAGTPAAVVAASSGYADQAHLSREVRSLAGVPLRELLS